MDVDLFTADLDGLSTKMTSGERDELVQRMNFVKYRLIELYKKNLVKINHSVMELVCARHLFAMVTPSMLKSNLQTSSYVIYMGVKETETQSWKLKLDLFLQITL